MGLLDSIASPGDLRALSDAQLEQLASEIRDLLIRTVATNSGHLGPNLGVGAGARAHPPGVGAPPPPGGVATRPPQRPATKPRTVNANPSSTVIRATNSFELTDADFAGVTSGSTLQRQMLPNGQLPGLSNSTQASSHGLPGMRAGQGGGAGSNVSNQINRSLQQGLAPLKILTGDR